MAKLFFFHPEVFIEGGIITRKRIVDRSKYEIVCAPLKLQDKRIRHGGILETRYEILPDMEYTIPAKSTMSFDDNIVAFMNPNTREYWLTGNEIRQLGLRDFSDLAAYSKIKNMNNSLVETYHNFRHSSLEQCEKIKSLETRFMQMDGQVSLLHTENRRYKDMLELVRESVIDAESRMHHYRAKMKTFAEMYKDADTMMVSGLATLGESLSGILASTKRMLIAQDEVMSSGTAKGAEIQRSLQEYKDSIKKGMDEINSTLTRLDKEVAEIQTTKGAERKSTEPQEVKEE